MDYLKQSEKQYHFTMREYLPHLSAWVPFVQNVDKTESVRNRLNVWAIDQKNGEAKNIRGSIIAKWIGNIYRDYLKNIRFVRRAVIWGWRNAYPLYINLVADHLIPKYAQRWRFLIKLSKYVSENNIQHTELLEAAQIKTIVPKVFPSGDQSYLSSTQDFYNSPPVYVAAVSDAFVYGGTNLVMVKGGVICHDLYDFERDYTSEELHGRTLIDAKGCRIRWLLHDDHPEYIPTAACFTDACAHNYAHWLTEVLPRIAVFCANKQFKDIPIIVNDGLHDNIMESLLLIAGPQRLIVTLPIGRAIQVDSLYITSVAGYVPFDRRGNKLSGHSHGVFNPEAFELIRKQVIPFTENLPEHAWPEKIYLRRNSGTRMVRNESELEALLVTHGYRIIETENLTFLQQVQLFRSAKEIISPTGGALANAIFSKPCSQKTIIMAKHVNMIYRYWLNMLAPMQDNISYVLGDIIGNHQLGIHADYYVDPNNIIDLIASWKSK